jgi:hypothetical protein
MPEPADAAIVFAPAGTVVPGALANLRKGGTVAIAGIHLSDIPALNYEWHLFYERDLRTVTANTREDGHGLFREAAAAGVRPRVTTYALRDANAALLGQDHFEAPVGHQKVAQRGEMLQGPLFLPAVHRNVDEDVALRRLEGVLEVGVDLLLNVVRDMDGHVERVAARVEHLAQLEVLLDAVHPPGRKAHGVVGEVMAEFLRTRRRERIVVLRLGGAEHQPGLQQTVEVDRDVVAIRTELRAEVPESCQRLAQMRRTLEDQHLVEARMAAEHVRRLRLHGPVDLGMGVPVAQRMQGWQCAHHIADGAQPDD